MSNSPYLLVLSVVFKGTDSQTPPLVVETGDNPGFLRNESPVALAIEDFMMNGDSYTCLKLRDVRTETYTYLSRDAVSAINVNVDQLQKLY